MTVRYRNAICDPGVDSGFTLQVDCRTSSGNLEHLAVKFSEANLRELRSQIDNAIVAHQAREHERNEVKLQNFRPLLVTPPWKKRGRRS